MEWPRVDVTWRISGLFRDLFPAQLALLDAAVRAVAAREEGEHENPLAAIRRAQGRGAPALARIFGTAPGAYLTPAALPAGQLLVAAAGFGVHGVAMVLPR